MIIQTRHRPARTRTADLQTELARQSAECLRLRAALVEIGGASDLVTAQAVATTALQASE